MTPVPTPTTNSNCSPDSSAGILKQAREHSKNLHKYDSNLTRLKITEEFENRTNGKKPYEWQLNVAEALLLGLDSVVIAGTGAGKTMPFMMPILMHPKKHVIIISPLDALETDQAQRFRDLKLTAVAVNGKSWNTKLQRELEQREHQIILTSPEMCLQHSGFCELLSGPKLAPHILAIIIDEAHCISQWGDKFCEEYSKLGTLRAFVPSQVPILVTSATMPPPVLNQVCTTMHISKESSYYVNLGINRPNITWEVRRMKAAKSDLESLRLVLPKKFGGEALEDNFKQTMVFEDDINTLMAACRWTRENISADLHDKVAVFHSRRTQHAKRVVLDRFQKGEIKVLFTTEAAGMGCDMPHIELVVQFMVPASLSIWMQRAGRAGRSPTLQSRAVLLVQPTVFQQINVKKESDKSNDQPVFVKNIEEGLRTWVESEKCRRDVADEYFASGVRRKPPTGTCCDNCSRQPLPERPSTPVPPPGTFVFIFESPSKSPSRNGKRTMVPSSEGPVLTARRDDHLKQAKTQLVQWRYNTWMSQYSNAVPFGPSPLLPDPILDKIASKRCSDVDALMNAGWNARWAKKHGEEVLQILRALDIRCDAERKTAQQAKAEAKKRATAERNAVKRANTKNETARKRAEKQAQPKLPRPACSPSKPVLTSSITENVLTVRPSIPLTPASPPLHARPVHDDVDIADLSDSSADSLTDHSISYYATQSREVYGAAQSLPPSLPPVPPTPQSRDITAVYPITPLSVPRPFDPRSTLSPFHYLTPPYSTPPATPHYQEPVQSWTASSLVASCHSPSTSGHPRAENGAAGHFSRERI